jgi:adenosylcobyric acid synthase
MNPVLLKPESETGAQVILQGKRLTRAEARDYAGLKPRLMAGVMESFARLKAGHDLVIVEGAGSPAEVNLRAGDIANMGFAVAADVPVLLMGDIDRGGVIAQIVGTQAVLEAGDAAMVAGFIINRFRGDMTLFDDGYRWLEARTGWRGFGVVPWFHDAWRLPAEDAVGLVGGPHRGGVKVVVLCLPGIANFDDLDPLKTEPGVDLVMLRAGQVIPGDAAAVILPGSKSTVADLGFLRGQGWDLDLLAHRRRGGRVLGLCGGYQMLGQVLADPEGIEGVPDSVAGSVPGLGLLAVETVLGREKRLALVEGVHAESGAAVAGYEIHLGMTAGPDCARPFARIGGRDEGAVSADGRVAGTYLHGLFAADGFRRDWLARLGVTGLGATGADTGYEAGVEATLEALADHLEAHLDVAGILALAR